MDKRGKWNRTIKKDSVNFDWDFGVEMILKRGS